MTSPSADDLGLELVAQVQGEAERVEAGAEVGRGGRHRHRTGPATNVLMAGQARPAAAAAALTSASTTTSTSWPKPSSAVAVSFRPWPVTVMTTVLPA